MANDLEQKVREAVKGDRRALNAVVEAIQDRVYNLALRMLWHPEDAQDASQEILIRVVTNLVKFDFQSAFTTWVYRVASNHCLNYRQKRQPPSIVWE